MRRPKSTPINAFQLLVLIFIGSTFDLNAQSAWKKISPTSWNERFQLLGKGPGKRMVSLGDSDHNVVTLDGINWRNTRLHVPEDCIPDFVEYASETVVWAGFNNGGTLLRKSTNSGMTWNSVENPHEFSNMKFVPGTQTGYAGGFINSSRYTLQNNQYGKHLVANK